MIQSRPSAAVLLQFFVDLFQDADITPTFLEAVSDPSRLREFTSIDASRVEEILHLAQQVYREDPNRAIDKGLSLHTDYCNAQFAWLLSARNILDLMERLETITQYKIFNVTPIDRDTLKIHLEVGPELDNYNLLFGASVLLGLLRDTSPLLEMDLHCSADLVAIGTGLQDKAQCRLKANSSAPYLILHLKDLEQQSLLTRNDALSAILQNQAKLKRIDLECSSHVAAVVTAIRNHMHDPDFSMADLAAEMNTSQRSLQRRLQEQHLTFKQLVKRERQRRAVDLIESGRHDRSAIVEMVGYRELSSLYRLMRNH